MDKGKLDDVVFLDIRKAFDSVVTAWITAVFRPRKKSKPGCRRNLFSGHFYSYFISMTCLSLQRTTPCLYADDTQIFASSADYGELIDSLNHDLCRISHWLAKNKLQHHPTKTKVMIIGSNYSLNNKVHDYPVRSNKKLISRTNSFECLGVVLD